MFETQPIPRSGEVTLTGTTSDVTVGVNDTAGDVLFPSTAATDEITPPVATSPPRPVNAPGVVPRMIQPSTVSDLIENAEPTLGKYILNDVPATVTHRTTPDVPFNTEHISPDTVGDMVHDIVYNLVQRVRSQERPDKLSPLLDTVIRNHASSCPATTQAHLKPFLRDNVVKPLQATPLWERLQSAATVHTEVPLGGRVSVPDPATSKLTFEFDATADLVLQQPDGTWEIVDFKLTLGDVTETDQNHFKRQIALYQALLAPTVNTEIDTTVQILGVEQASLRPTIEEDEIQAMLSKLSDFSRD